MMMLNSIILAVICLSAVINLIKLLVFLLINDLSLNVLRLFQHNIQLL